VRVSSDPASFYTPDRYLAESEKRLAACNPEKSGRFVFVRGRNVQEALEREETAGIPGLSALIPSLARQRENVTLVSKLYAAEGKAYMAKTGLRVVPTKEGALLDPDSIGDPYLAQMVRSMVVRGGIVSPCPDGFSSDDPNIVILEPKRAIEDMFATFSSATMKLLAWSLAVLGALLVAIFRRRSFGYVASVAATFVATAGMLGWLGVPVTFFTLLCFFAVAGLGLDYAIFTRSSAAPRVRQVVFFAFLTSFAGLGMLSFTDFAVTRAMGLTFACGLFFAWLCAGMFASGKGVGQKTKDERQTESLQAPSTRHQAPAWHLQREQSAGRWRMLFMWYMYVWLGKSFQKVLCIPVMAFIYPFARPAREALREFYKVLKELKVSKVLNDPNGPNDLNALKDVKDFKDLKTGEPSSTKHQAPTTKHQASPFTFHSSPFTIFSHLLGFAWSLADKTDACTLRKNLPKMSVRDDAGWRAFDGLVRDGKGAFLISTHLGTIEVFPALSTSSPFPIPRSPFVHAFQQMGHDAVFTEVFARHLDSSRLALHPVEEIGVETAVRMQEAIGRGELVLMAGDRVSAGSERVLRHDFLGRPCVWPKGVFVFAKLMESPVFFVTCVRTGWNAYEVHVREFVPSGEPLLPSLLDAYVRFLEEETLAHPEQWYQFYRFFAATK
jgi:predicted LPLAT superfamily acyltransferase